MKERKQADIKQLLAGARKEINALDAEIIKLLGRRFKVVHKVSRIKIKYDLEVYQWKRVKEVMARNKTLATRHGLDPVLIQMIYTQILAHAHACEDWEKQEAKKKRATKAVKAKAG